MTLSRVEYVEKVLDTLESFHYDEMVAFYNADQVARTIAQTIAKCREVDNISATMCAVIIWSLTMTEKILPEARKMRVN